MYKGAADMLVRFTVENFRSFRDIAQISLVANGRLNQLDNHTMTIGDLKLLKAAYVYGANASGKSNLIKAVDFAREIIVEGSARNVRLKQYNKMIEDGVNQPGVFQFEILIQNKVYSYGFALSYQDGAIAEEWLYELRKNGTEFYFFVRDKTDVTTDLSLKGTQKTRFDIYAEDIRSVPKDLFLTELAEKPLQEELGIFKQVYRWFEALIVIFPDSEFGPLPFVTENEEMQRQFEKFLMHFDTGIQALDVEHTTIEDALEHWPKDAKENFLKDVVHKLSDREEFGVRGPDVLLALRRHNNEFIAKKLRLKHREAYEGFDLHEESDGTQRLFDLVPLLFDEVEDRVAFVDEIDRNMHPNLTREFVELFYQHTNNTQMVVTTHESSLLDLKLLRRDEIWLIERQLKGSALFSLDDFKVRYDKEIEKAYLLGRYGAVPLFDSFEIFTDGDPSHN